MAAGGFLILLDDIAAMTKAATIKALGVSGDDLAVKSAQVGGIPPAREIPVILAVAKGSLINKTILLPLALLLGTKMPWAVTPVLMLGGLYLCFEGAEGVMHALHRGKDDAAADEPVVDYATFEKEKVRSAVRTDLVMSTELMMMAVGTFTGKPALQQVLSLTATALVATAMVYALVMALVKADDGAIHLMKQGEAQGSAFKKKSGEWMMRALGAVLRALPVVGTIAVFAVGGSCVLRGIPAVEHAIENLAHGAGGAGFIVGESLEGLAGVATGFAALGVYKTVRRFSSRAR